MWITEVPYSLLYINKYDISVILFGFLNVYTLVHCALCIDDTITYDVPLPAKQLVLPNVFTCPFQSYTRYSFEENLLAHNNIIPICYCGQISSQSAAVNCQSGTLGGTIYFAGDGICKPLMRYSYLIYTVFSLLLLFFFCREVLNSSSPAVTNGGYVNGANLFKR